MAEGGGGSDEGNPFSFKKYVKEQNSNKTENNSSAGNETNADSVHATTNAIPDSADTSVVTTSEQSSRQRRSDSSKSKRSRNEENTISFKKFLQTNTCHSGTAAAAHSRTTFDLTNDLPDFVQQCSDDGDDQWLAGESGASVMRTHDASLPDFALHANGTRLVEEVASQSDSPPLPDFTRQLDACSSSRQQDPSSFVRPSANSLSSSDARPRLPDFALQLNGLTASRAPRETSPIIIQPSDGVVSSSQGGALPDFLSYNVVSTSGSSRAGSQSDALSNGDCLQQLVQLQEENAQLRAELLSARQLVEEKSHTMEELHSELNAARQREREETAALMAMVQQVEANLSTTMKRASCAESRVQELEHELKTTKVKVTALQTGQACQRPDETMGQRVQMAADQLTTAAKQADSTIKQLSSGVELIRDVSRMLASLGKLSEVDVTQPQPGTSAS